MNMEWPCANRGASGFYAGCEPAIQNVKDQAGQKPAEARLQGRSPDAHQLRRRGGGLFIIQPYPFAHESSGI
jgi:hypothetical protein